MFQHVPAFLYQLTAASAGDAVKITRLCILLQTSWLLRDYACERLLASSSPAFEPKNMHWSGWVAPTPPVPWPATARDPGREYETTNQISDFHHLNQKTRLLTLRRFLQCFSCLFGKILKKIPRQQQNPQIHKAKGGTHLSCNCRHTGRYVWGRQPSTDKSMASNYTKYRAAVLLAKFYRQTASPWFQAPQAKSVGRNSAFVLRKATSSKGPQEDRTVGGIAGDTPGKSSQPVE